MPKTTHSASDLSLLDAFWREPVTRTILPNGLTLIVKPDRSAALASVQIWVKTGSIHEDTQLGAGLSHYLEHMLFKGTARRSCRQISSEVQAQGGNINAYTTFDRTVYHIDLPSENTNFAIDLLSDIVLHSTLPADEAAKEKEVILREIAMTRDDPEDRLWLAVFSSAFREHPYRQPIIGHSDVFSTVSPADLGAYYRARYVPNNVVVVVVGDVDPAAVSAEVSRCLGGLPRGRLAPVLVPAEPLQLAPREHHALEAVQLTRAVIAWQIPGLSHPDAPVLDLLSMVAGHGESSLLWRELRETSGLVHTIDASTWNPGSSGLFCVTYTCEPEKREAAAAAIERTLARAATRGFTATQLRKAVRQLVVDEINTRKTMSGQASRLGAAEVVVGDIDYSRSYFQRLNTVVPGDLKRAVATYLRADRRTFVTTSPAGTPAAAAAGAAARGGAGRVADFTETTLSNGARLVLQPDPRLPNLHFRLLIGGGTAFEEPGKRGSTALLATLLTKDTHRHDAAEIARHIEEVGGTFASFSGNNSLGVAVEVLPPDADRALSVISEALLVPAFKASTFATERDAQAADLREEADDVVSHARRLIRQKFFGSSPLALDPRGDLDGIQALKPADIGALMRQLCVAPGVVLAVSGDIPRGLESDLKRFLEKIPSKAAGGGRAKSPAALAGADGAPAFPANPGDFTVREKREQAVVLQAFPSPRLYAGDYYAGEVADELFSGMASRLFERVREQKALAYFVRSTRVASLSAGMFLFFAGTRPGREDEVVAEIDAEVARVQDGGVEEAELRRCQVRLKAGRRQAMQTNAARAFQAGLSVLQGKPADHWKKYDGAVDAVTREDLARFARTYFLKTRRTQLIVKP